MHKLKLHFIHGNHNALCNKVYPKDIHIDHYITKSFEEWLWKINVRGITAKDHRGIQDFFEMHQNLKYEDIIQQYNYMRYSSKQSLRGYDKAAQGSITPTLSGVVVSDPRLPHEMKGESNDSSDSKLIVTYNVEDASDPTQLYFYMVQEGAPFSIRGVDIFDKVEIDGTEVSVVELDSNSGTYQLSVGEHTIAYTLKDPTFIGAKFDEQTEIPTKVGAIFSDNPAITSVTIPNSVTTICNWSFEQCSGLTFVAIPNNVTNIEEEAFAHCTSVSSITIGSGVTSIGNYAFGGCSSLTSIIIDSNNTVYDSRNNCNAIIETDTNTLITGCPQTVIPNTVTSIGDNAFVLFDSLTDITIPSNVTNIGDSVFVNCHNLSEVTVQATTPPTLGTDVFINTPRDLCIFVPSESVSAYRAATNWSTYQNNIIGYDDTGDAE